MPQCCDREDVTFTLAFLHPGSPRLPADGSPIEAYFDNIVTAGPGFEMDHPLVVTLESGAPPEGQPELIGSGPIDESGGVLPLDDEDVCDKPQLAFAIGVILSGS